MLQIVIAVVITLIVTAVLTYFITTAYHKNVANAKIGNAEDRAREIIDEAVKTAAVSYTHLTLPTTPYV